MTLGSKRKFFFYMVGIYLIVMTGQTIQHEHVHEQAAIHSGCIYYNTVINPLGKSYFECYEYGNRTETMKELEYLIDQTNEVVSYNLDIINFILVMGILILGLLLIEIKESNLRQEQILRRYW